MQTSQQTLFIWAIAIALSSVVLTTSSSARAEYRVFRLKITDTTTNASRTVVTTLDNLQYPGYHQIRPREFVSIDAHWWCWDRPQNRFPRDYCPQPPANAPKYSGPHYQP